MYGGSVGSAVFGIGGIEPFAPSSGGRKSVAPIPWLEDAPRGSAVWRSRAGVTSAAWAASTEGGWGVWVNVSLPASDGADVHVMLPRATQPSAVCAWECGLGGASASFTSTWVSFDGAGGHEELQAVAPAASAAFAPTLASPASNCMPIWQEGEPSRTPVPGIANVSWLPARAGRTMFPALNLFASSGAFAVFARECGAETR